MYEVKEMVYHRRHHLNEQAAKDLHRRSADAQPNVPGVEGA
jgi:hypothetical protein